MAMPIDCTQRPPDRPTDPCTTADRINELVDADALPLDQRIIGAAAVALNDRYVTEGENDAFARFSDKIDRDLQPTERNMHEIFQQALLTIRAHQNSRRNG